MRSFDYSDDAPWPEGADGDDFSLVLLNPNSLPDHSLAVSWRLSSQFGGSPGSSDECPDFVGDPNSDLDQDGIPALIEYFLGGSDGDSSNAAAAFQVGSVPLGGESYPTFGTTYKVGADQLEFSAYISTDLENWSNLPADVVVHDQQFNGDGTVTIVWRSTTPVSGRDQQFFRLRVKEIAVP